MLHRAAVANRNAIDQLFEDGLEMVEASVPAALRRVVVQLLNHGKRSLDGFIVGLIAPTSSM